MLYKSFPPCGQLYSATVDELRDLGLTRYEAMCYISLASLGPADPRKIAADAGIPYPNAYEALRRLANMGWVELVKKRPATYRARRPESIKEMISSKLDGTFQTLSQLYKTVPAEDAELVYTLRGREKVLSKMYEMIEGARESIILVSPTMGLEGKVLGLLQEAVSRKVRIRAIVDDGARSLPKGIELRTGNLVAIDLLVDDKAALISLPDYSACGWVDSPQVAGHFKQFLELMWSNSSLR
jgi:HTH-type transcriptional regulator, sugar sensing transcriptional regulator